LGHLAASEKLGAADLENEVFVVPQFDEPVGFEQIVAEIFGYTRELEQSVKVADFLTALSLRLELVANTGTQEQLDELRRVAPEMLEEWSRTKKAPKHAAWLHELEFKGNSK